MTNRNDFAEEYAGVKDTATALGVSVSTVNRMLADGTLPRVKAGWSVLIDLKDIKRVKQERAKKKASK